MRWILSATRFQAVWALELIGGKLGHRLFLDMEKYAAIRREKKNQ